MLGPVPGARGLWLAAGLSLNGFGGAGGMGKVLAEWIIEGEPSLDLFAFHGWRFGRSYADPTYAAERTREGVKYYYYLRFPQDENEWARPRRISPVHHRLQELGAVFGEKNGWERVNYFQPGRTWRRAGADQRAPEWQWGRPPFFERVAEEHRAVRERAGLFEMTSFGKVDVRGPGALPLLQRVADNNLDVPAGKVVYTQFLNTRGGVLADVTITRLATDHFRVVTGSGFIGHDLGWIQMQQQPDDGMVEIRDVTEDFACFGLWGPKAREVLASDLRLGCVEQRQPLHDVPRDPGARLRRPGPARHLRRRTRLGAVRPARAGRTGVGRAAGSRRRPRPGDRRIQGPRLPPAGKGLPLLWNGCDAAGESLRGRPGLLRQARQGRLHRPGGAGRGQAGAGPSRRLCTVTVGGEEYLPLFGGEAVTMDGEIVGRLRSAGYGFTLRRNIAYTYLPSTQAKPGLPIFRWRSSATRWTEKWPRISSTIRKGTTADAVTSSTARRAG